MTGRDLEQAIDEFADKVTKQSQQPKPQRPDPEQIKAQAQIQSIQNIEVRAKVKGYVETINVDEGQNVRAGQLLFTIRPREYEAELQKAEEPAAPKNMQFHHADTEEALQQANADGETSDAQTFVRRGQKVGRNDACPCGSGKKYKYCHGKLV